MAEAPANDEQQRKTQLEFSGGGPGCRKRTAVGTGDSGSGDNNRLLRILAEVSMNSGVIGSVVVGHDGILQATDLEQDVDPEAIAVWSLGLYVNTTNITKRMGHSHLHQLVARSNKGYLLIADFGGGILSCLTNISDRDRLLPLMRNITRLVAQ